VRLPGLDSGLGRELEVAMRLAREAGAIVLEVRTSADLNVELKAGDEPVTIADKRSSELVMRGLHDAFPDDVVISEESDDDLARLTAKRVWYIDPIDGTKDFIAGRPGFSVMIGLTVDHKPVLGVVYQPLGDRMYWATPDAGAWALPGPDGGPMRMHVSDIADAGQVRLVASASHRTQTIDEVKSALGIANELNIGSVGLKLALIALGERDLYVNPSAKSKLWDTCAPEAILTGAGGLLTDAQGNPVRYDLADLHCRNGLVASNTQVHAEVLARLAHLFPKR
jgi:3'(2'), 5'-bisphosphate nucleotidase